MPQTENGSPNVNVLPELASATAEEQLRLREMLEQLRDGQRRVKKSKRENLIRALGASRRAFIVTVDEAEPVVFLVEEEAQDAMRELAAQSIVAVLSESFVVYDGAAFAEVTVARRRGPQV